MLGFFFDTHHAIPAKFSDAEAFRIGNFLEKDFGAVLLLLEVFNGFADVAFDDVVSKDDADGFVAGKIFRQSQRFSDAAFTFLIGIVDMLQAKVAAVSKKTQKFAGVFSTRYQKNFVDARVDEGLNRVVDHRLVIHRQQMFVGYASERVQATSRSTSEHYTLHAILIFPESGLIKAGANPLRRLLRYPAAATSTR